MKFGRTILLVVLVLVMDSMYLLEQPSGSSILMYPRVQWFIRALTKMDIPASWLPIQQKIWQFQSIEIKHEQQINAWYVLRLIPILFLVCCLFLIYLYSQKTILVSFVLWPRCSSSSFGWGTMGGPHQKETMLLCSCKRVGIMDRGRLQQESHHSKSNLARKYLDSSGRTRWQGTSALKGSQPLSRFCFKLQHWWEIMKWWNVLHPSTPVSNHPFYGQRTYPAGFARSVYELICWWQRWGKRSFFENAAWISLIDKWCRLFRIQ